VLRRFVGDPERGVAHDELRDHCGVFVSAADAVDLDRAECVLVELDSLASAPHRELRDDAHLRRRHDARIDPHGGHSPADRAPERIRSHLQIGDFFCRLPKETILARLVAVPGVEGPEVIRSEFEATAPRP
jgi:hypothetical protein